MSVPRVVGSEIRFEGCLSSPSFSSRDNSILCFRPWESPVCVPQNALRTVPSSMGIYQGSQTSEEGPEGCGSQSLFLSGRLPDLGQVLRGSSQGHKASDLVPSEVGIPYKLEKISSAASKEIGISGSDCGSRVNDLLLTEGKGRVDSQDLFNPLRSLDPEKRVGIHSGVFELHSRFSSPGEALAETHSEVGESSFVSPSKDGGDSLDRRPKTSSSALDGQVVPFDPGAYCSSYPSGSPNDRCLGFGLGSSLSDPFLGKGVGGGRQVASSMDSLFHELVGVESDSSLPPSFSSPDQGNMHLPVVGQHHRTFVHPQTGFSGFSGFVGSVPGDFSFLPSSFDHSVPLTSQRDPECPGRQGLQGVPISTEWALDEPSFLFLCQRWGCPDIDIMATWENSKLSRYISPCPDYLASHMDCFSLGNWDSLGSIYIFPPWTDVVIEKVLQRLVSFRGQGFLIAPRWPSKVWFTALEARCPINIELPSTSYLSQLVLGEEIIFQEAIDLNLHAWKL